MVANSNHSPNHLPTPPTLADLRRVHGIVRSMVPHHFDTENLAVDILIESCSKHHPEPAIVFIRNRCNDYLRVRGREAEVTQDYARHNEPTIDPEVDAGKLRVVKTLMAVLSPQERKIVWYRFYCDTSTSEIARVTELPVNVVREVLSQALFKMKQAAWELRS